eukprot:9491409-Pyramimonas_sp.AAC.1
MCRTAANFRTTSAMLSIPRRQPEAIVTTQPKGRHACERTSGIIGQMLLERKRRRTNVSAWRRQSCARKTLRRH